MYYTTFFTVIVHPCKLLIIFHDCYTFRKPLIAVLALVEFFKISVRAVQLLYASKNKSTSNLEHLQHFDGNGIIGHPCKLLIIVHDCYTLRKPLVNDMHYLFIISYTLHC